MKVRLLTSRVSATASNGYGEIIDMLDNEAVNMISTSQAELVPDLDGEIETPETFTEASATETAVIKTKRNNRRKKI